MNPTKLEQLEIRSAGNEVLVHDPLHGKIHVLNETAGYVLELCDGSRTVDELAQALHNATRAELSIIRADLDGIIDNFIALRLLRSAS